MSKSARVQFCCGAVCSVVAMGRARRAGGYVQREVTARGRRIWPDTFRQCVSREQCGHDLPR